MQITRYKETMLPGLRETTRIDFPSGRWAEITRYTDADHVVISALGSTPGDYSPYSWGRLHYFRSRAMLAE